VKEKKKLFKALFNLLIKEATKRSYSIRKITAFFMDVSFLEK